MVSVVRQMQPRIMDIFLNCKYSIYLFKIFKSWKLSHLLQNISLMAKVSTNKRLLLYAPRDGGTPRQNHIFRTVIGNTSRHFSIPTLPRSIQPTVSLGIRGQAAHTVALSLTCLQPSVRRPQWGWNWRLLWSQPPTYLGGAGDAAEKCAEGIHGRAAPRKHLSTNTGPEDIAETIAIL